MKVQEIMSKKPVWLSSSENMWAVKRVFDKHQFHHILVIDQGILTGVLSDRDYLKTVSPNVKNGAMTSRDLETMSKKIHQVMSRKIISIGPNDQVMQAVKLFNANKISCLPVVEGHKAVGILSWRDVMRFLEARVTAKRETMNEHKTQQTD